MSNNVEMKLTWLTSPLLFLLSCCQQSSGSHDLGSLLLERHRGDVEEHAGERSAPGGG